MVAEQKVLYFSEALNWFRARSANVPLTLICAPSGYGKTIALKSISRDFKGKVFRINLHGSRQQDFFEEFCQAVLKRECSVEAVSALISKGMPHSKEEAEPLLGCLRKVCAKEPCMVVIDNYCRVEKPDYTELLYYIANELSDSLHIVAAGCHIDATPIRERIASGEVLYISKEDLRLKERDIPPYFFANGVEIGQEEANEIYRQSEGWHAVLYAMLRNYRMTGKFFGFDESGLADLLKHNNYMLLPVECRRFLNRVFPARSFTREEGIFLAGGGENAELLFDYTVDKSGFIFYDCEKKTYHLHPLYRKIVKAAFDALAIDEQNAILGRYEAWKKEHRLEGAQLDLLTVFNEGSRQELEDKVETLGIESRLDREQLKQMLVFFQKKESGTESPDP